MQRSIKGGKVIMRVYGAVLLSSYHDGTSGDPGRGAYYNASRQMEAALACFTVSEARKERKKEVLYHSLNFGAVQALTTLRSSKWGLRTENGCKGDVSLYQLAASPAHNLVCTRPLYEYNTGTVNPGSAITTYEDGTEIMTRKVILVASAQIPTDLEEELLVQNPKLDNVRGTQLERKPGEPIASGTAHLYLESLMVEDRWQQLNSDSGSGRSSVTAEGKEGRVGRRSGHEGRPFAGGGEEAGDGSTVREDRGEGAEWRGRWDGDGDGRDSEGVAGGTCSGSAGRGDRQGRRRLKVGQRAGLVGRVGGWGSKQGKSRGLADSEWTERGQSA
ncbi:hypothetical protein EDB85DRAFT_1893524 [Lactarius pseudohatsudake]|nr:hypothetical protein EDB85DRAFT_1893524 [Lactarius pseudohatsudake]